MAQFLFLGISPSLLLVQLLLKRLSTPIQCRNPPPGPAAITGDLYEHVHDDTASNRRPDVLRQGTKKDNGIRHKRRKARHRPEKSIEPAHDAVVDRQDRHTVPNAAYDGCLCTHLADRFKPRPNCSTTPAS